MNPNNNKTQKQNEVARSRSEQWSEAKARERIALIETRRTNRELRQETVLTMLKSQLPKQYELAEIVGRWIWLEFPKVKHRDAANTLYRLGFHWNNRRLVWQHPCGACAPYASHPGDPREKYGSRFPFAT